MVNWSLQLLMLYMEWILNSYSCVTIVFLTDDNNIIRSQTAWYKNNLWLWLITGTHDIWFISPDVVMWCAVVLHMDKAMAEP